MTDPDRAVKLARARAAAMRADGAYDDDSASTALGTATAPATEQLFSWALVEPDLGELRSTRRWGVALTALKHVLLRLLRQYNATLLGQQSRYNVQTVVYLRALEGRVASLERRLLERGDVVSPPPLPRER